jgi:hypothetical protein
MSSEQPTSKTNNDPLAMERDLTSRLMGELNWSRREIERLRAALTTLLHNVQEIGLNGVSVEHPHVLGVAMARDALASSPVETSERQK